MNREGLVVKELNDNLIEVTLLRHTACGNCGACHLGEENLKSIVLARNEAGAKSGDVVEITMADQNVLQAAFIAYVIPLITLISTVIISYTILKGLEVNSYELIATLIGLLLMFLVFFVIKSYDNKFKKSDKYLSRAITVVKQSGITKI